MKEGIHKRLASLLRHELKQKTYLLKQKEQEMTMMKSTIHNLETAFKKEWNVMRHDAALSGMAHRFLQQFDHERQQAQAGFARLEKTIKEILQDMRTLFEKVKRHETIQERQVREHMLHVMRQEEKKLEDVRTALQRLSLLAAPGFKGSPHLVL